ncbi:SMP-30/gluconolactonase/LRE family protein [Consotaella aegiceratis]|uniref:SMP-30/gluconolactonase/LRE family protein n=1 Tax=Consotaella aegiceratis TaxID=3097961 RepID=UPI002F3EAE5B
MPAVEPLAARPLSDAVCQLGEGPTYDPAADALFWFDIVEKKLFEHRFPTGETVVHALPFMASSLALLDDDRHVILAEDGLYLRQKRDGELSLVAPLEADNAVTRSNDARVHPSGAFWMGTMGKNAEKGAGTIYWFHRGEIRTLYSRITIPNAICFSPDGALAYFTDTKAHILHRVEVDPANGLPVGVPTIFNDYRGEAGGQDGAVCDADGLVWNACYGTGRLDVYAPSGERVRSYGLPASQLTCPAFIGAKANGLAVTSAWEGMSRERRADERAAGQTFLLDLAVSGRLEPRIALGS